MKVNDDTKYQESCATGLCGAYLFLWIMLLSHLQFPILHNTLHIYILVHLRLTAVYLLPREVPLGNASHQTSRWILSRLERSRNV
jgi:hypothetical protein